MGFLQAKHNAHMQSHLKGARTAVCSLALFCRDKAGSLQAKNIQNQGATV